MTDDEKVQHVLSQISGLPGKSKPGLKETYVLCPYHRERTPSGRIKHSLSNGRSIGTFNCFGCGQWRKWNDFATENGLQPFVQGNDTKVPPQRFDYIDDRLLPDEEQEVSDLGIERYRLSPLNAKAADYLGLPDQTWRGFSFGFLRKVGCELFYHRDKERYFVFLPVYVKGTLRGYIKGLAVKYKKIGYLNAPGSWALKSGLFPYDYAVKLMHEKGHKTLVLVEGPRDALRLLKAGIPALCILGTQSWSPEKVLLLEQSGAESLALCMDGDSAGKKATRLLYSGMRTSTSRTGERLQQYVAPPLHELFTTWSFNLWDYEVPEDFPDKGYDPGNMPRSLIRELKTQLSS